MHASRASEGVPIVTAAGLVAAARTLAEGVRTATDARRMLAPVLDALSPGALDALAAIGLAASAAAIARNADAPADEEGVVLADGVPIPSFAGPYRFTFDPAATPRGASTGGGRPAEYPDPAAAGVALAARLLRELRGSDTLPAPYVVNAAGALHQAHLAVLFVPVVGAERARVLDREGDPFDPFAPLPAGDGASWGTAWRGDHDGDDRADRAAGRDGEGEDWRAAPGNDPGDL